MTGGAKESGDSQKEELSKPDVKEGPFQTPVEKRKPVSPAETLQLQNIAWVDPNEESGKRGEEVKKSLMMVPNGPPVTYGPPVQPSTPLFSPEQVAQANDPRNMSPLLPFGRDLHPMADSGRLGLLQGFLPGFDQLQGLQQQRQREYEWRLQIETMIEQLGLQLRASQSENQRLREELAEIKRDTSRDGIPDEKSIGDFGEASKSAAACGKSAKEDGVVTQQVKVEKDVSAVNLKRKFQKLFFISQFWQCDGNIFIQINRKGEIKLF